MQPLLFHIAGVVPQLGHGQPPGLEDHDAQQLRGQAGVPAAAAFGVGFGAVVAEAGALDVLQRPVVALVERPLHELALFQLVIVVEAVAGEAVEHPVGLHRIDMDEFVAFPVPEAVFAAQGLAAALLQGAVALRHLLGIRGQIFAHRHRQQHQENHRAQHHPADLQGGHPGGADHRQLAAVGHQPQADQGAEQNRHGQIFMEAARHRGEHELQRLHHLVTPTQELQLVDKAEQAVQTDDDRHDGQRRQQHRTPEIPFEQGHARALLGLSRSPKYSMKTANPAIR